MPQKDGSYLVVTHVKDQPLATFEDSNLGHAKDDVHGRAQALLKAGLDFHIFIVDANDRDNHYLDVYTRDGKIPGIGPVSVTKAS